jgi:hypothetical protein
MGVLLRYNDRVVKHGFPRDALRPKNNPLIGFKTVRFKGL